MEYLLGAAIGLAVYGVLLALWVRFLWRRDND
jgi:hypothetical protein